MKVLLYIIKNAFLSYFRPFPFVHFLHHDSNPCGVDILQESSAPARQSSFHGPNGRFRWHHRWYFLLSAAQRKWLEKSWKFHSRIFNFGSQTFDQLEERGMEIEKVCTKAISQFILRVRRSSNHYSRCSQSKLLKPTVMPRSRVFLDALLFSSRLQNFFFLGWPFLWKIGILFAAAMMIGGEVHNICKSSFLWQLDK